MSIDFFQCLVIILSMNISFVKCIPCNISNDCPSLLYCDNVDYGGDEFRKIRFTTRVCTFLPNVPNVVKLKDWGILRCNTDRDCRDPTFKCKTLDETNSEFFGIRAHSMKKGACVMDANAQFCPDETTVYAKQRKCDMNSTDIEKECQSKSAMCYKGHCCPQNYMQFGTLILVGSEFVTTQSCDPRYNLIRDNLHSFCSTEGKIVRMGRTTADNFLLKPGKKCVSLRQCDEDEVCGLTAERREACFKYSLGTEHFQNVTFYLRILYGILGALQVIGTIAIFLYFRTPYYKTEEERVEEEMKKFK